MIEKKKNIILKNRKEISRAYLENIYMKTRKYRNFPATKSSKEFLPCFFWLFGDIQQRFAVF